MTPEQEKVFEDKLKEELEKARLQGLSIGMKTVVQIMYDKVKLVTRKNTKNDLLRVIKDIKLFCEKELIDPNKPSNGEIEEVKTEK